MADVAEERQPLLQGAGAGAAAPPDYTPYTADNLQGISHFHFQLELYVKIGLKSE